MIRGFIVDDESHNRSVLNALLAKHCPDVHILGESGSAEQAYMDIRKLKPELVFLDIKMPNKSGFDLLKQFAEIDFEVVFVTAFDEYAIHAFEFNALGYLLKPIDYTKLIKVIDRIRTKRTAGTINNNVLYFVKTLEDKSNRVNKLSIHHHDKVIYINISDIIMIEAKEGNCEIHLQKNEKYYSSKDLKQFENVLNQSDNFLRISKSVLINKDAIISYSKGLICILGLSNGYSVEVSRRKKSEIIEKLKNL